MSQWRKILDQIVQGAHDSRSAFDDVCGLLERLGFDRRTKGGHNVFVRYRLGDEIDG